MLHVTNGDSAADRIRAAQLDGDVLAWRDPIHEGPVPPPATLDSLRPVRARFLATLAGTGAVAVAAELEKRDRRLGAAVRDGSAITLWFEHDLYDQLQLAQVLDFLGQARRPETLRLALVQAEDYLGTLEAGQLPALWAGRHEVTDAEFRAARRAWAALASDDPTAIEAALDDLSPLPFMRAALVRHLEEFPAVGTGLSRTERQALEALADRPLPMETLFRAAHHEREEAVFLGDLVFVRLVEALGAAAPALVRIEDGVAAITDVGREVLAGRRDRVETCGIDRWLGGVRLAGRRVRFRWDSGARTIVAS